MFQLPASLYNPGFPEVAMSGNPLIEACWDKDFNRFIELFHDYPYPNKKDKVKRILIHQTDAYGHNCLHTSAYRGCLPITEFLVRGLGDNSPYINTQTNCDLTPLHLACRRNHVKIVELLLRFGAEPSPRDMNGWAPLHFAAECNSYEVVKLFIEKGCPIDPTAYANISPVFIATVENNQEIGLSLAHAGADICRKSTFHDGVQYVTPYVMSKLRGWGDKLRQVGAVPDKPEKPFVLKKTDKALRYQWLPPPGRSAPVEYYKLQVRKIDRLDPDAPWITVAENVNSTTHTFYICQAHCSSYNRDARPLDLLPSEVYSIRVFAYSMVGWSQPSDPSVIVVTAPAAPCRPDPPLIMSKTSTSIKVRWIYPNHNGVPVDKSELQWTLAHTPYASWASIPDPIYANRALSGDEESSSESDTDDEEDPEKGIEFAEYVLEGMKPDHHYKFRVRCHNVMGWSYYSDSSKKASTPSIQDGRGRVRMLGNNNNTQLIGAAAHSKARFAAMEMQTVDRIKRIERLAADKTAFRIQEQQRAASTKIQALLRGTDVRCKYANYRRDLKARKTFLIEYEMEDSFRAEWRAKLLKWKNMSMQREAKEQAMKSERRARKLKRRARRERRQLTRVNRRKQREQKDMLLKKAEKALEQKNRQAMFWKR